MQLPLQITFRNMEPRDEVATLIREKAAKLEGVVDSIVSCCVVVEPKGRHRLHGNLYDVRIDLTVPGVEIAATRHSGEKSEYRDVQVAIRDAFDSVERQLEDYIRCKRGFVKTHAIVPIPE